VCNEFDDVVAFICRCPYGASACLPSNNQTCAAGYDGKICGVCAADFHNSGQSCTACSGSSQYYLFVAIFVALLALIAAVYISNRLETTRMVSIAKVYVSNSSVLLLVHILYIIIDHLFFGGGFRLVSYLQVMGSSQSNYKIPWPTFMDGVLGYFRIMLAELFQLTAGLIYSYLSLHQAFLFDEFR
jgi:hypothetical protein